MPNEVYLVFDWDDDRPYAEYLRLPEVQKALAETGTNEVIEVGESFRLNEWPVPGRTGVGASRAIEPATAG